MGSTLLGMVTAAVLAGSAAGPSINAGGMNAGLVSGLAGADGERIAPIEGSWARSKGDCAGAEGGDLTIERHRLLFGGTGGRICKIGRVTAQSMDSVEVHTSCDSQADVPVTFRLAPGGDEMTMRQRILNVRLMRCR